MNTPHRTRVSLVLLMGLLFTACTSSPPPQQAPNIVFIMSDDHAYQAISAYSDKLIETPNIDRIAQQGCCLPMPVLPIPFVPQVGQQY